LSIGGPKCAEVLLYFSKQQKKEIKVNIQQGTMLLKAAVLP